MKDAILLISGILIGCGFMTWTFLDKRILGLVLGILGAGLCAFVSNVV